MINYFHYYFIILTLLALTPTVTIAVTTNSGNGFRDHGVAVAVSNHRGTVATVDGRGHDIALMWLMDHTGGYELLLLDATDGHAEQFPMPFTNSLSDSPYASILSSHNKFYTHFADYFVEFDPAKHAFTFCKETTPQMAMSMTEDDHGVIWSATFPQCGVVSFNPATRQLHDYGQVYHQNWQEYPRYIAADDTGWIYIGIGNAASQIISVNPVSGKATPVIPESDRTKGIAYVYRDLDGKVYGYGDEKNPQWYELYRGVARKIGEHKTVHPKPIKTGTQALFLSEFPDGRKIVECDLVDRKLVIENKDHTKQEFHFNYNSQGAPVMDVAATSDGTICGGTTFPMRFFSYQPKTDRWINRPALGQWNAIAPLKDHFFVGVYPGGRLLDWQPAQPWVDTVDNKPDCNPAYLFSASPFVYRPTKVLPDPKGQWVILAGGPDYGYTGGGLLIWDRHTRAHVVLTDAEVVPNQSTRSLVLLPDGKLLGGTTIAPGSGGEKKATQAELYQFNAVTRQVEWHAVVFPYVLVYTDLQVHDGLVFGIADRKLFFVFDPRLRKVVYSRDVENDLGLSVAAQGPRVFVAAPSNAVYALFAKGIAEIDPATYQLKLIAQSSLPIDAGGDYLNGRIYFASGSHLYSYQLP
jgi:hypothetical protein